MGRRDVVWCGVEWGGVGQGRVVWSGGAGGVGCDRVVVYCVAVGVVCEGTEWMRRDGMERAGMGTVHDAARLRRRISKSAAFSGCAAWVPLASGEESRERSCRVERFSRGESAWKERRGSSSAEVSACSCSFTLVDKSEDGMTIRSVTAAAAVCHNLSSAASTSSRRTC